MEDFKNLVVIGDIHGNFKHIWSKIKKITDSYIVFAGDVGLGFAKDVYYQEKFSYWDIKLQENRSKVFFLRGNHDNPNYWKDEKLKFTNVKLAKDYDTLQIGDKKVLFLGGATSIDRTSRTEGKDYWKDEAFELDVSKVSHLRDITHVISHNSPTFVYPYGFNSFVEQWFDYDYTLRRDLIKERSDISKIYYLLKTSGNPLKHWLYGHFHQSNAEIVDGTHFRLLNINEIIVL